MNIQIAICDDSQIDREYIENLVQSWAKEKSTNVQIRRFSSAEAFLFHYEEDKNFDILLLDIEMGKMDGVSLAKKLRKENETLQIVFVTGYSDYIQEGYEVSALHYLMKPVHQTKLFSVLDRAVSKLEKNEKVLMFELSGEMVRLPIYTIRYAEVEHNYVTLYAKERYTFKMTLSELMEKLDERFYRISRSALVNLNEIRRVTKNEILLQDGTKLALPRGAYDGINQAIIKMG